MTRFRKDVLRAGRYSVPSPDGKSRRVVEYTGPDVAHLARRAAAMRAAGLTIPVAWEHQDDAKPVSAADRLAATARHNLGFVEAEAVEGDALAFELDVPSDDDAARLPSVRYVSPEIVEDYVDGSGRLWPGKSITHVAVTARPVQHQQQPFQKLSVVRLSLADRLGENAVADDKKDDKEMTGGPDIKKVLEALATLGVALPDDTTMDNLTDRLIGAAAAKGGVAETTAGEGEGEIKEAEGGPVMMALTRRAEKAERQLLEQRVRALKDSGRVSKPIADKLLAETKTVRLSFTAEGDLAPVPLLAKVEAYEALEPARHPVSRDRLSELREVPPPSDHPGRRPETEAEAEAVVAEWNKAMGRGKGPDGSETSTGSNSRLPR